eukprot:1907012-Rhodomonas_salina.1
MGGSRCGAAGHRQPLCTLAAAGVRNTKAAPRTWAGMWPRAAAAAAADVGIQWEGARCTQTVECKQKGSPQLHGKAAWLKKFVVGRAGAPLM